ncbi:MAG: FtsX-like permease family protein [Gammaproteobacteria bacterium]|nr:FtsX-like permease family protein [Gammaproteobacteria bacterium]
MAGLTADGGLLWRASRRFLASHPWQLALAIAGIALGVAVVVSIHLTRISALNAYDAATVAIAGSATHRLYGGPAGLDEGVIRTLAVDLAVGQVAPVVSISVMVNGRLPARVLGIDPLSEAGFARFGATASGGLQFAGLMTTPTALASPALLEKLGIAGGTSMVLRVAGNEMAFRCLALDPFPAQLPEDVLVTDIAFAQDLTASAGYVSYADLILSPTTQAVVNGSIGRTLPADAVLVSMDAERGSLESMSAAFQTNLMALGMLALMVGAFLTYNAVSFLLLQRRELFGRLRTLGATRRQLGGVVLLETMVIALVGTGLGLLLGLLLAEGLLHLVVQTLNDLYAPVRSDNIALALDAIVLAVVAGMGAGLLATLPTLLEILRAPPEGLRRRIVAETQAAKHANRALVAGGVLIVGGCVLLALPGRSVALGFTGLFCAALGFAVSIPRLAVLLLRFTSRYCGPVSALLFREALRSTERNISRTGTALAALTLACATAVGIGTMVESFRVSVSQWLVQALPADIYVIAASGGGMPGRQQLDDALVNQFTTMDGVADVITSSRVLLPRTERMGELLVQGMQEATFGLLPLIDTDATQAWHAWQSGGVLVTETFVARRGLAGGDTLELLTPAGPVEFNIVGVYRDYGAEAGGVMINREVYRQYFQPLAYDSIGLRLADGVDIDGFNSRLQSRIAEHPNLQARLKRDIQKISLVIFDRTFAITRVLRTLALLIATVGIFGALMALTLERGREYAVRRALGFLPSQSASQMLSECGVLGIIAGSLAIPAGLAMAAALIFVINARSFGWTMPLLLPPDQILWPPALALVAAVAAGIIPAWRLARHPPVEFLRDE